MELLKLGSRVKAERKRQGLTLEVLSERIGISRNFLWEIEAGRKAPALTTLYNLSISLNVSIDYLMGVTEENRHIISNDTLSERDIRISKLLKQLHGYNDKELYLISNVLNDFNRYFNEKQRLRGGLSGPLLFCTNPAPARYHPPRPPFSPVSAVIFSGREIARKKSMPDRQNEISRNTPPAHPCQRQGQTAAARPAPT